MRLIAPDGNVYPLKIGRNCVGRVSGNDIVLADRAMSRRHAELHWDGQHCVVVDLGSTNGTFLNGQRLAPHQPQPVPSGARLGFGPTMVVTLVGDMANAAIAHTAPDSSAPLSTGTPSTTGLDLIFLALDVALDYRKLGVTFLGLLVAGLVSVILAWIFAEVSLDSIVLGVAIALVGLVALWLILTFVTATITRLASIELSEGRKVPVREAMAFVGQHFLTFLFSPLVLLIGLVLTLVAESVFLLLGRVNYLGELVTSLAFLPLVLVNLLVLVIAWFGTALTFPIIADRGEGIGNTLSYILTIVRRAPGRLIAYMTIVNLTCIIMLAVCFYLLFSAFYVTSALTAVGMEPTKFVAVLGSAPISNLGDLFPELSYGLYGGLWHEPPATYPIASFLFGLSVLGLLLLALTIPQLFYLAGTCAVYLNLHRDVSGLERAHPRRK